MWIDFDNSFTAAFRDEQKNNV